MGLFYTKHATTPVCFVGRYCSMQGLTVHKTTDFFSHSETYRSFLVLLKKKEDISLSIRIYVCSKNKECGIFSDRLFTVMNLNLTDVTCSGTVLC